MPLTRYYIKEKRAKWHKNEYLTLGEWRLKIGWFVGGVEVGFMSNDSSIFWFGALFGFACACILFSIFGVK